MEGCVDFLTFGCGWGVRFENIAQKQNFALFISARPECENSFSRPYISFGSYGNTCYAGNLSYFSLNPSPASSQKNKSLAWFRLSKLLHV